MEAQQQIDITLLAVMSRDFYIADLYENGDFSSPEDKRELRKYLKSDECDCFICGRKTGDEFADKLSFKPLLILTSQNYQNKGNIRYVKTVEQLFRYLKAYKLKRPALLGGKKVYELFLKLNAVQKAIITIEKEISFESGIKFNLEYLSKNFNLTSQKNLSPKTTQYVFEKKHDLSWHRNKYWQQER
ncbi:MAG: dihydrofolate reductase [Lactobacillus sp.]|jgi:dihydrofolate reductase|nr:dihydrofolate reductase [Lactobacillus sp.]